MSEKVRIAGAVKARRQVEVQLEGDAERACLTAAAVASQIEGILQKSGAGPGDLPLPTRKAYFFLSAVAQGRDGDEAALEADVLAGAGRRGSPRRPGKAAAIDFGRLMWRRRRDFLRDRRLLAELHDHAVSLLGKLRVEKGDEPLGRVPRALAAWLEFLLESDHLKRAVKALDRAERAAREVLPAGTGVPEIVFVPADEFYLEVLPGPGRAWHVSAELFGAPKRIWKALATAAFDESDSAARQEVEDFLGSPACAQYRSKLAAEPEREARLAPAAGATGEAAPTPSFHAGRVEHARRSLASSPLRRRGVWVAGILRLPKWYLGERGYLRLHGVFVADRGSGKLYGGALGTSSELGADEILMALGDIARGHAAFGRYRPGRIVVDGEEAARRLKRELRDLEIDVVHETCPADLAAAAASFQEFQAKTEGRPRVPGLLEPPGMTIDRLRRFAGAAHDYHEAAIWKHLSDEDHIEIEPPVMGMRHMLVTGSAGISRGLVIAHAPPEDESDERGIISLTFDPPHTTFPPDQDLFDDEGLPVHGGEYPNLIRVDGERPRRLAPANLALLEGILRALAETTVDDIDAGHWRKTVITADGPLETSFTIPTLLEEARPTPSDAVPDRPSMPETIEVISKLIEEGRTVDELQRALGSGGDIGILSPFDAIDPARALAMRAHEAPGRVKVRLAREALTLDPSCAPAHLILGEFVIDADPVAALPHFERAMETGRAAIDDEDFEAAAGSLWRFVPARDFLIAKLAYTEALTSADRPDEARPHLEELLRLTTGDNQGARYPLAGCLLELEDHAALRELARRFEPDASSLFEWAEALVRYREDGDVDGARHALMDASEENSHFKGVLLHGPGPSSDSPGWSIGERSEAEMIARYLRRPWKATPGALLWLASTI